MIYINKDYKHELLDAIEIMIDSKLKNMNNITTGTVVGVLPNNRYNIKIKNNIYNNIPSLKDIILTENQTIVITMVNGNINNMIIIGGI